MCDMCMCVARDGVRERGVSGREDCVWALKILWEQGECWTWVCILVSVVWWCRWGVGRGLGLGSGGVV